jgi:hypothetical protein
MKITPLILFLILLFVLIISMLFGNSFLLKKREGFVSFGYNNNDNTKMIIPKYSSDVNKQVIYLYDNLYFDGTNANLIEVDSSFCSDVRGGSNALSINDPSNQNVSCNDSLGRSIQNIYITTRSNITKSYPSSSNLNITVQESSLTNTPNNNHFSYITNCPTVSSIVGYKYQIFYSSWENDTYMHIMGLNPNVTKGINIQSYYYDYNRASMKYVPFLNLNTDVPLYKASYSSIQDSNNGKLYNDLIYKHPNIYQITKYVKYDLVHGCVLIWNPTSNTYNVYSRKTGQIVTDISSAVVDNIPSFVSWIIPDGNNGMVIIMAQGINTLIMVIHPDPNQAQYLLSNCVRFTDKEVYLSSNSSNNLFISTAKSPSKKNTKKNLPCHDELSCKWYYYFKTIGNDPAILFKNDFIRKTQIVPPVCPTCPKCSDSDVCTNCGGKGGSGTTDTSGNNILKSAAGGTVGLTKEVVGGTVGLTKDVVGGTVGLTKDVVGGAVGLTKDVVGGAVGLTKEAVGGAVGLVKDTASGIYNIGDKKKQNVNTSDNTTSYDASSPVDQYSYYGALKTKGGNFMPVTADFSSFRK